MQIAWPAWTSAQQTSPSAQSPASSHSRRNALELHAALIAVHEAELELGCMQHDGVPPAHVELPHATVADVVIVAPDPGAGGGDAGGIDTPSLVRPPALGGDVGAACFAVDADGGGASTTRSSAPETNVQPATLAHANACAMRRPKSPMPLLRSAGERGACRSRILRDLGIDRAAALETFDAVVDNARLARLRAIQCERVRCART